MKVPRIMQPFVKLTSYSKNPTDEELDIAISQLEFLLPPIWNLFKHVVKGKIKRFFKYEWKIFLIWIFFIFGTCSLLYFTVTKIIEPAIVKTKVVEKPIYTYELKSFNELVEAVKYVENSGKWDGISKYGMLGAFQFDQGTLKNYVGIHVDPQDFVNNKELQLGAFKHFLLLNYRNYYQYVSKWRYKTIKNVKGTMTESGILMAFHLRPASAEAFFKSNGNDLGQPDANGTYVNRYIEEFSGYDIPFIHQK